MKKCLVTFCKNRVSGMSDIYFFTVTEKRYELWMRAIGRDPLIEKLSYANVICSEHFGPEDLIKNGARVHVRKDSVPHLKLKPSENLRKNVGAWVASTSVPAKQRTIYLEHNVEPIAASSGVCHEQKGKLHIKGGSADLLELMDTSRPSSTTSLSSSSTDSEPMARIPFRIPFRRKNATLPSEGLKTSSQKRKELISTFHNYSLTSSKQLKKESTEGNKVLNQQLKTSKQRILRLSKRINELKGVLAKSSYEFYLKASRRDPLIKKCDDDDNISYLEPCHITKNGARVCVKANSVPHLNENLSENVDISIGSTSVSTEQSEPQIKENFPVKSEVVISSSQLQIEDSLPVSSEVVEISGSTISQPVAKALLPVPLKKRKVASSTDSEGLKNSPKEEGQLVTTVHNYSLPPTTLTESPTEGKRDLNKTLRDSKQHIRRLCKQLTNLKEVLNQLKKIKKKVSMMDLYA